MTKPLKLKTIDSYGKQISNPFFQFENQCHLGGNIQGGDSDTFYPELWKWLVETFNLKTIMDVGCAEGLHTRYFEELGCKIVGVEGLLINALHADAAFPIIINDFRSGFVQVARVDLTWCCEVLEHIDEASLDHLMQTLLNGRWIAVTHALPGQGGHHHVNEKPARYWQDLFKDYGCEFLPDETQYSRTLAHSWYRKSGMLFHNTRWEQINARSRVEPQLAPRESATLDTVFQRLNRQVEHWIRKGCRVAVYGAGAHTAVLQKHTRLFEAQVIALVDRDPEGKTGPCAVFHPEELAGLNPDVIVISSLAFQQDIYNQLEPEFSGKLVCLYEESERSQASKDLHLYL